MLKLDTGTHVFLPPDVFAVSCISPIAETIGKLDRQKFHCAFYALLNVKTCSIMDYFFQSEGRETVTTEHFEKILPQLVNDLLSRISSHVSN